MKRTERQGLDEVITESVLRKEAGDRAYERGAAYFEFGAVTDIVVNDETINARVEGGDEYAVQLWNEKGELGYSCTCPVGDDGIFCKHGVAAGLAWLADRTETRGAPQRRCSALASLMRRTKQENEFGSWLETVRTKHKAKRNFMQRIDKVLAIANKGRRGGEQ